LKVVSDTSPIIAFSILGKLHVLKALFERIAIPRAVYDELRVGKPFQPADWLDVRVINDRSRYNMLPKASETESWGQAVCWYWPSNRD